MSHRLLSFTNSHGYKKLAPFPGSFWEQNKLTGGNPVLPQEVLQMRRSWGVWHRPAEAKDSYYFSSPPDLCLQDLVEEKMVRIFFFKFRLEGKIFMKLVSLASDSWLVGMSTRGFCFSLPLASFLLSFCTSGSMALWTFTGLYHPEDAFAKVHLALSPAMTSSQGGFLRLSCSSQKWFVIFASCMMHVHLEGSQTSCGSDLRES